MRGNKWKEERRRDPPVCSRIRSALSWCWWIMWRSEASKLFPSSLLAPSISVIFSITDTPTPTQTQIQRPRGGRNCSKEKFSGFDEKETAQRSERRGGESLCFGDWRLGLLHRGEKGQRQSCYSWSP